MKPDQAPFNTAVFYDIENLLGGYNFNVQWVAELSLKDMNHAPPLARVQNSAHKPIEK